MIKYELDKNKVLRFEINGIIFHVTKYEVFFPFSERELDINIVNYVDCAPPLEVIKIDKRVESDYSKEEVLI